MAGKALPVEHFAREREARRCQKGIEGAVADFVIKERNKPLKLTGSAQKIGQKRKLALILKIEQIEQQAGLPQAPGRKKPACQIKGCGNDRAADVGLVQTLGQQGGRMEMGNRRIRLDRVPADMLARKGGGTTEQQGQRPGMVPPLRMPASCHCGWSPWSGPGTVWPWTCHGQIKGSAARITRFTSRSQAKECGVSAPRLSI